MENASDALKSVLRSRVDVAEGHQQLCDGMLALANAAALWLDDIEHRRAIPKNELRRRKALMADALHKAARAADDAEEYTARMKELEQQAASLVD